MPGRYPAPLVVGTQVTITRGQLIQFPSQPLGPGVLVPYEVNAIRMCAYPSVSGNADSDLRGFLKWQFYMGKHPLTDSYVPMWNLSPNRQQITNLGGYYEWRFARPLLLPPGGRIDAKIQLQANTPNAGGTPTITAAVAYAGRLRHDLSRMPQTIEIPFCSCWDTTVTGAAPGSDPLSLRNPLQADITVNRFVGNIQNDTTGTDATNAVFGQTLQIFDPRGVAIHQGGTIQFHALFPTDTASFPYTGVLPMNTHFMVRLDTPPSATSRPMISYLGSRYVQNP